MKKAYLIQIGIDGTGPEHPLLVSYSQQKLIDYAKQRHPNNIWDTKFYFDSKDCVHIKLNKEFYDQGVKYNMFFIDTINII